MRRNAQPQPSPEVLCLKRAKGQDGLITTDQALSHGLSPAGISRRTAGGRWRWVLPRVIDVTGLPLEGRRRWRAALLWAGPDAALCLRSAGELWGLIEACGGIADISLRTRPRSPARCLRLHHDPRLARKHVKRVQGLQATDPQLTLIQLATVLTAEELDEAIHVAITKGLTSAAYLRRRLDEYAGRGRTGVAAMRAALRDVDDAGGVPMTKFETRLFRELRRAKLPLPIPQYLVTDEDGWRARPDFAYPEYKVAIEAHSFRWHGSKLQAAETAERRARLTSMGWFVLEIMWEVLDERPQEAIEMIARTLGVAGLFL